MTASIAAANLEKLKAMFREGSTPHQLAQDALDDLACTLEPPAPTELAGGLAGTKEEAPEPGTKAYCEELSALAKAEQFIPKKYRRKAK